MTMRKSNVRSISHERSFPAHTIRAPRVALFVWFTFLLVPRLCLAQELRVLALEGDGTATVLIDRSTHVVPTQN
jgi:hypothetical protein